MSSVYFRSIWNTNNLFIKNGAINTPSYNTVDQNNLIAEYGQIVYNSTTNTVNFFSNTGVWNPIVPTNNITIGNLNFSNNTISSTTGDIILFPNSAVVKITGALNMQTNNIINVGTINTLALPTSTFVGINDSQVLTNKTINGSQLVNNSVSLDKMSTLTANSIIGNNTGVSATPLALSVTNVKTMLGLDNNLTIGNLNFNNNTISSTTGDVNIIPLSKTINFSLDTINLNPGLYNQVLIQTTPAVSSLSIQSPSFLEIKSTGSPGTIYFTSIEAIISQTKNFFSSQDDYTNICQNSVNIQAGGTHIMFNHNNKMSITLNNGASYLEIIGTLDMKTNNIINVGTINTLALPTSTFVGINDSQVLTNKTINGSQLVNNSVSLTKMSTLTPNTIIGNNTGVSATPIALDVSQVRSLLSVNFVENQSLSSWTGSNAITTVGNVASGNLVAGFGTINCGAITSDSITAKTTNLLLNGVGSNFANVATNNASFLVSSTVANQESFIGINGPTTTNNRHIACYQNGTYMCSFGLSGVQYFYVSDTVAALELFKVNMGGGNNCIRFPTYSTNGILRIDSGVVTVDTNFTTSTNNINCDSITAKTTNSNLTLNGNGTGIVNTNAPYIYIANNRIDTPTYIVLDGTTVTKDRYIACHQNGVHKLGFGLSTSSYFFIWDNVNARDLFQASITNGNIRFPTYSTNGILRIDSGTVTVENNFTTGSNTINVDTVRAKTTNSDLFLHPNGTGTVVTNSPVIYIASNRTNTNSAFSLDGPTVTDTRFIACYQNGAYKLGFGLQATSNFFVYDPVNNKTMLQVLIGEAQCIRFPTYTTGGTLSVALGSGVVQNSSDRRLKQNEELLNSEESLQQIMNLQPKKYIWKNDVDNRTNIGFVAQDVELEIPEAIDGKKYEYELIRDGAGPGVDGNVRVDENGIPVLDYDKPRYRGLDQCAILSVLVSAFQELHNSINIKLSSIENRLTALETVINVS